MSEKKIIDYLEQLELSEYEIKLYFIILEVSPKSVRELAHILEVNPTTAYLHIERLIEKELVMRVIRGAKMLIVPNKPDDILTMLVTKKVESASTMQKNLSTIAGALKEKYSLLKDIDEAEVKYYKGKLGIKKIYEEALKAEDVTV